MPERFIFSCAYGDSFTGDNHDEALSFAHFAVSYARMTGDTSPMVARHRRGE